jgi:ABC-type sugar transport system permease subunit
LLEVTAVQGKKRFRWTFEKRQKLGGFLFTLPFVIGFLAFFLVPFGQSVIFSFNEIRLTSSTYELVPKGFSNYGYALFVHPEYLKRLTDVMSDLLVEMPFILAFSFFAATLLNQKFRGRGLVRVVFFLPVIYAAGIVQLLEMRDYGTVMLANARKASTVLSSDSLKALFATARLPSFMTTYVNAIVESLPAVIRASGVQILIFLAGLQSIPPDIYEAADVEGATSWEKFWMITFPLVSPLILTNLIFTIIDSFTDMNSRLMETILDTMWRGSGYGASMAMSMIYFGAVAAVLGVAFALVSRRVFYRS